WLVTNGSYL
nr:Chain C, Pre-glycoprotein polyprotein GP complex [Lymphocytic choriomeningitis virus (strain Armstrong)]